MKESDRLLKLALCLSNREYTDSIKKSPEYVIKLLLMVQF